jgi:protein involved in polysaccharide export with SLBB domain
VPIPHLSPGDRVRVTVDAVVELHEPGHLELAPRMSIDYESEDDLSVEVVLGRFRRGDVVTDGTRTLMRTVIVRDGGAEAYWVTPDGSIVRDDEVRPEALRLLLRIA